MVKPLLRFHTRYAEIIAEVRTPLDVVVARQDVLGLIYPIKA